MLIRVTMVTLVLFLAGVIPANPAQANATVPDSPDWSEPFPPHRMIGNIYYVGSRGLASYLITTPAGNILIDSNLKSSVPLIRENIEKLGFRFGQL
jgi:metallo-beta-lactamase class B